MFEGLKNSVRSTKSSTKHVTSTIFDMVKEIPKLPFNKMPIIGWAYIAFGTAIFAFIIFVLVPLVN